MDGEGVFFEASLLRLGVSVGSSGEDNSFISKREDDHSIVLVFGVSLDAPDFLRLVVADRVDLFDFESLLNDSQVTTTSPRGVDGINLWISLFFEVSDGEITDGSVLLDAIDYF